MLVSLDQCRDLLRCPRTKLRLEFVPPDKLTSHQDTSGGRFHYPIINGVPVLIDFENSVLSENEIIERAASSIIGRKSYKKIEKLIKRLLSPTKKTTRENISKLVQTLSRLPSPTRVLVIGGGQIGQGLNPLYEETAIHIYSFDLYASPNVQFIADAHQIPFADGQFDAVVIQAVLEHVLQPADVVAEIWRVLKNDGLVYAETPFLQQVHEGAYDFTRFTDSGHRYLFRRFEIISSGASGGPGIQFMGSVDCLIRSIFRSRILGKLAKLAVFWAQYLDRIIPEDYSVDGASGVFFYGKKSQKVISAKEIITYYKGAQ